MRYCLRFVFVFCLFLGFWEGVWAQVGSEFYKDRLRHYKLIDKGLSDSAITSLGLSLEEFQLMISNTRDVYGRGIEKGDTVIVSISDTINKLWLNQ